MEKLTVGILAHVDAGKTTLSEALLFSSGNLKKLGRVDHRDAFLDTHDLEREKGITIFSKQAVFPLEGREVTLLDTPGHVDFSSEAERTLQILDCAILVVSGADGVQGHTQTLWRLLKRYGVPTFLFVNKMDLAGADRAGLLAELKAKLDEGCADAGAEDFQEQAALCGEEALASFLDTGVVPGEEIAELVAQRRLFPCWFGSALKLEGVAGFARGLARYAPRKKWPREFGARVYKIGRDHQGARLTYLKITGGSLRVKTVLQGPGWEEKVDQIRLYSGAKFQTAEEVPAGTVCAVTGLSHTKAGQGLGREEPLPPPLLEPALTYQLLFPQGTDLHAALGKLRQLEEEDPQLHVLWKEGLREIHLQLMGQVQLEILGRLILDRFGLEVEFGPGSILYRETIAAPVLGVGHFEPLRHYAEVHLLLEPGERGSGLTFRSACPEDQLDRNWQRLILTHLEEKEHLGVLTGAPITDMTITLLAGRAHPKHTEGGDFRQATYRAVRQGLMGAQSVLLEPWYDFRLELPAGQVGRAMSDLQRLGGEAQPPESVGADALLTGSAPVSGLRDYAGEVASYTRGRGRLTCLPGGYRPCHDPAAVLDALAYDPLRDVENTPDSVFCDHGAGYTVRWDEVPGRAHVSPGLSLEERSRPEEPAPSRRAARGGPAEDRELMAIYERTYGPVKRREFQPTPKPRPQLPDKREIHMRDLGPEYLLVDGYNIIFAWEELKAVARQSLDAARQMLMDLLSNYQGFQQCEVILVFDAYKVKGGRGEVGKYHNIHLVYTKEAETADAYIEKVTYELGKHHRVRVATSDGVEQMIILGHGALRLSARVFKQEMEQVTGQISAFLAGESRRGSQSLKEAYRRAKGEKDLP